MSIGERWLDALSGIDLENRIPRGKIYTNTGRVLSLNLDFDHHQHFTYVSLTKKEGVNLVSITGTFVTPPSSVENKFA